MTDWLRDARVGLRSLLKKPGFTLVAVLTLGVGLGANTAIYSFVQAVMMHPLPFPEPERLVQIWETAERDELELRSLSFPVLEDLRGAHDVFASVAGSFQIPLNVNGRAGRAGSAEPERIMGEGVSPSYFSMLGATTLRGRFFTDEDDRYDANHPNVVLSEALWERRFGASPAIIGQDILVNEVASTIVGVTSGRGLTGDTDLWFPLETTPQLVARFGRGRFEQRGARWLSAVGRLKPDVSAEALDAWMARETERLRADYPRVMDRRGVLALPLEEQLFGDVQQTAAILMIAVGFVMLIACANLASLLLARGVAREREIALRIAIGATRSRVVRQLLAESLVLAFLGGAAGVVLALWSKDALRGLSVFEQLPGYVELGIDARTLGFAALLSVVTAFVFGIAPAIAGARLQPGATLKGMRGRGAQWLSPGRGVLVSVQVALAMLLTVASGLMLRSLSKQLDIDPAFRSDGVYTLRVQLPARRYDGDAALGYSRQLEERVGALPGVLSVAMSSDVPLVDGYSARSTRIEDWLSDRPDDTVRAYHHAVSPGFFSTLDIDLSAGRDFSWFDNREAPRVVVVSRKMAERSWPGENPLGKRISFSGSDGPWRSVVGVVEDIRYRNLVADTVSTSDDPDVYSPLAQEPTRNLGIVIDASGTTVSLESVRAEIRAMDAAIPVYAVRAMADVLDEQLALPRFAASLLGLFGGVALLLAAGGLYGLLAHLVAQRSREIGIQMALGATGAQISRRIVRQGLVLPGAGILFGLAASVAFGRFLESRLFEVSGTDPWTLATSGLLLLAVAIVASYLPARRATRLDPVVALRQQ